jgi:PEP-CTERM/exosortase A-associated glycosyltransferase
MKPSVVTSPLHQQDDPTGQDTAVGGISYLRTIPAKSLAARAIQNRWPFLRELSVVGLLQKRIKSILRAGKFDIVHAHSPALCGLAGLRAAKACGVPFVYEIRAFWEDAAVDQNKTKAISLKYALGRKLETYVTRHADAVVGIAKFILKELESRQIDPEKMFHIPNGVDSERFKPRARDEALAAELGVTNVPVLGFLGTFFPWEGVSWLVRAATQLKKQGQPFKLIIVGDGADASEVRKAIQEENAADFVSYLGRVPNNQVERYYSVMDVLVYPRKSVRIAELVTPLKPLEAMALEKAVLGSSVGGIRELIDPGVTGELFTPGDIDDFCRQATRLLQQQDLRHALGKKAREKIAKEKNWKSIVSGYINVYEKAIQNAER